MCCCKKYNKYSEKKELSLTFIWDIRNKLYLEGNKIRVEGNKRYAEGILKIYDNIKLEWKNWDIKKRRYECHLENGEVYKP